MSTQTITKKRKSADGDASATKKVKVAKSAEKPAPVKSALKVKKPAVETAAIKTKSKSKPVIEAHEVKTSKPAAKATKPAKKPSKKEKITVDNDEDGDGTTTLTPDQTASLLAGFSSEDEDDGADESEVPTSKLPKAPTTGDIQDRIASATKALKTSSTNTTSSDPEKTPGIVYVGRIPHGFHEPQMRAYFSQFGSITHLKLARNRKTGKSKHFAFVEFASSVVADIVAKTMDKYLLFGHLLQVRRVPQEQVGEGMWVGEGRRGWNVKPNNKLERGALRRGKTREEWGKKVRREERKRSVKAEKLMEMGYEFEMPAIKGVDAVPVAAKDTAEIAVEDASAAGAEDAEAAAAAAPPVGVVQVDEAADGTVVVEEKEKTSKKKRAAEGKPRVKEAKKVVKKVKT